MSSRSIAIAAPPLCCALTQVNEAANTPARANELTLGFTRKFMTFSNPNVQRVCNCALYGSESRYPDSDAHRYPAGTLGPKAVNVNRARWLLCEVKRIRLTVATDCARKGHLLDIPTTVARVRVSIATLERRSLHEEGREFRLLDGSMCGRCVGYLRHEFVARATAAKRTGTPARGRAEKHGARRHQ